MSTKGFIIKYLDPYPEYSGRCMNCFEAPTMNDCESKFCVDCCQRRNHPCRSTNKGPGLLFIDNSVRITDNSIRIVNNYYNGNHRSQDEEPEYLPPSPRRYGIPTPREVARLRAVPERRGRLEDNAQNGRQALRRQDRNHEAWDLAARLIEATGADCSVEEVANDPGLFQELMVAAYRRGSVR